MTDSEGYFARTDDGDGTITPTGRSCTVQKKQINKWGHWVSMMGLILMGSLGEHGAHTFVFRLL